MQMVKHMKANFVMVTGMELVVIGIEMVKLYVKATGRMTILFLRGIELLAIFC